MARLVHVQELRGGDLRQANRTHVADVPAEGVVHALIDALWLHRHVFEVGLAQHGALALAALVCPRCPVLELSGRLPFLRDLHEELERGLGVGDDAVIGAEHAPDLGRLLVEQRQAADR